MNHLTPALSNVILPLLPLKSIFGHWNNTLEKNWWWFEEKKVQIISEICPPNRRWVSYDSWKLPVRVILCHLVWNHMALDCYDSQQPCNLACLTCWMSLKNSYLSFDKNVICDKISTVCLKNIYSSFNIYVKIYIHQSLFSQRHIVPATTLLVILSIMPF